MAHEIEVEVTVRVAGRQQLRFTAPVKHNPNWPEQPRVPAGAPEGGEWTVGGPGAAPPAKGEHPTRESALASLKTQGMGTKDHELGGYPDDDLALRHLNAIDKEVDRVRTAYPKLAALLDKFPVHYFELRYDPKLRHASGGSAAIGGDNLTIHTKEGDLEHNLHVGTGIRNENVTAGALGTLRHELSHHLEPKLLTPEWQRLYDSKPRTWWTDKVSARASFKSNEALAESVAAYTSPLYGQTGKRLPAAVEKYLERTIGPSGPG